MKTCLQPWIVSSSSSSKPFRTGMVFVVEDTPLNMLLKWSDHQINSNMTLSQLMLNSMAWKLRTSKDLPIKSRNPENCNRVLHGSQILQNTTNPKCPCCSYHCSLLSSLCPCENRHPQMCMDLRCIIYVSMQYRAWTLRAT